MIEYNIRKVQRGEYVSPIILAEDFATLGEKDQAFEQLEKAYQERDGVIGATGAALR